MYSRTFRDPDLHADLQVTSAAPRSVRDLSGTAPSTMQNRFCLVLIAEREVVQHSAPACSQAARAQDPHLPCGPRAEERAVEAGSAGPAQRASSVHPVGRRPTAVDSRGRTPRCPQLSTALPCGVSVRWSREDQRAPGLLCSVMTCGLLISRAAPPVPRLDDRAFGRPTHRIYSLDCCFCTGSGRCSCRAMSLHFPANRAAGARIPDPV